MISLRRIQRSGPNINLVLHDSPVNFFEIKLDAKTACETHEGI